MNEELDYHLFWHRGGDLTKLGAFIDLAFTLDFIEAILTKNSRYTPYGIFTIVTNAKEKE